MDKVRQRHTSPQKERETNPKALEKETPPADKEKKPVAAPVAVSSRSCCTRGCIKVTVLVALAVLLSVGLTVSYVVSNSPKDLDEQWEDVQSYVQWWWATMRGVTPPCTYGGVRHYAWGGAVDRQETCGCVLRRCPPAPIPKGSESADVVRGEVAVSRNKASTPTVESLWQTCQAAGSPVTRDLSLDPLRVFDAPEGFIARGIFANVRSPMCVQSGRLYAALRPNSSLLTISYRTGTREALYTNLTDLVLQRGAKYHPITTVPAAGLLFSVEGQAGNLFTLLQEGLRGWAAVMEQGFGPGFTSDEDKHAWRAAARQAVFLSDPSMDIPQETTHSSEVARQFANAFTVPNAAPYFATALLSRTRTGEAAREPMYCFCGGFMVPSVGIVSLDGTVGPAGYQYLRETVNAYFGGAAMGRANSAAAEAARTGSPLYTSAVRAAWPPRAGAEAARRPRLLWIGRKRPRIAEEAKFIALAKSVGFEVLEDRTYVTEASAAEQFYLARYADVVAGFHGVALVNAVWMDAAARPQCRTLLEFIPYAKAEQVARVYGAPMMAAGLRYTQVTPVDVEFTGAAFSTPAAQETARRELMGEGPNGKYVMGHPAFSKHRAVYDADKVEAQLKELYTQLVECLQA